MFANLSCILKIHFAVTFAIVFYVSDLPDNTLLDLTIITNTPLVISNKHLFPSCNNIACLTVQLKFTCFYYLNVLREINKNDGKKIRSNVCGEAFYYYTREKINKKAFLTEGTAIN